MTYRKVRWHDQRTLQYRRPQSSFADNNDSMRHSVTEQNVGDSIRYQKDDTEEQFATPRTLKAHQRQSMRFSIKGRPSSLHPRTQEVFEQAMLYVSVFYFTHVWSTTTRIIQQLHPGRVYFQLAVVHSFCDPLQGFLNFLVYQRPRYRRIRAQNPDLSYFQVIRRVLRFSCLPSLDDPIVVTRKNANPISRSRGDDGKSQGDLVLMEQYRNSNNVPAHEGMVEGENHSQNNQRLGDMLAMIALSDNSEEMDDKINSDVVAERRGNESNDSRLPVVMPDSDSSLIPNSFSASQVKETMEVSSDSNNVNTNHNINSKGEDSNSMAINALNDITTIESSGDSNTGSAESILMKHLKKKD
jgi:hypothetical protein